MSAQKNLLVRRQGKRIKIIKYMGRRRGAL